MTDSTVAEFQKKFKQRFGPMVWIIKPGDRPISVYGEVTWEPSSEEGRALFYVWVSEFKNFVFDVDPAQTKYDEHQWLVKTSEGTTWTLRPVRKDQADEYTPIFR